VCAIVSDKVPIVSLFPKLLFLTTTMVIEMEYYLYNYKFINKN